MARWRLVRRALPLLRAFALVFSLGAAGLVFMSPAVRARRRRRADLCAVCRRRQRIQGHVIAVLAVALVAGTGVRIHQAFSPTPRCGGEALTGPAGYALAPRPGLSSVWLHMRDVVTAPISGIAYGTSHLRGLSICEIGGLTVGFVPTAAGTKGATVGDMFLTRVRDEGIPPGRLKALGQHESRHVDQWARLTLVGGPFALPVLYGLDETFFPGPRNHFERSAGLRAGGYAQPPSFGPNPQWSFVAGLGLLVLAAGRQRLRLLARLLSRRTGTAPAEPTGPGKPNRCPLHTPGWFRG